MEENVYVLPPSRERGHGRTVERKTNGEERVLLFCLRAESDGRSSADRCPVRELLVMGESLSKRPIS